DIFFFFSSRRRHTRLVSDWSSDVCSSDLFQPTTASRPDRLPTPTTRAWIHVHRDLRAGAIESLPSRIPLVLRSTLTESRTRHGRSEERRVGKECRSRGSTEH